MDWEHIFSLVFPAVIVLVVIAALFSLRYRITEREIQISILGITFRRISLYNIEEIKPGKALFAENWSLGFLGRDEVTIRKKHGLIRNVNIAPPDASQFINQVKDRIASLPPEPIRPGWKPR